MEHLTVQRAPLPFLQVLIDFVEQIIDQRNYWSKICPAAILLILLYRIARIIMVVVIALNIFLLNCVLMSFFELETSLNQKTQPL